MLSSLRDISNDDTFNTTNTSYYHKNYKVLKSVEDDSLKNVEIVENNFDGKRYLLKKYNDYLKYLDEICFSTMSYESKYINKTIIFNVDDNVVSTMSFVPYSRMSDVLNKEDVDLRTKIKWIYQLNIVFEYLASNKIIYDKMTTKTIAISESKDVLITKFHMQFTWGNKTIKDWMKAPEVIYHKINKTDVKNITSSLLWDFGLLCLNILYNDQVKHDLKNDKDFSYFKSKLTTHLVNDRNVDKVAKVVFDSFIQIDPEARIKYSTFLKNGIFNTYRISEGTIKQKIIRRPFKKPVAKKVDREGYIVYEIRDINKKFRRVEKILGYDDVSNVYYMSVDFILQNIYTFVDKYTDVDYFIVACFCMFKHSINPVNLDATIKELYNIYNITSSSKEETVNNYIVMILTKLEGNIFNDMLYFYLYKDMYYSYQYLYFHIDEYDDPSTFAEKIPEASEPDKTRQLIEEKRYSLLNKDLSKSGYQVISKLGEGIQGAVYKVVNDLDPNIEKACKIYDYRIRNNNVFIGNNNGGISEIAFSHVLKHPYLINTDSFYPGTEHFYLILELADNTLENVIKQLTIDVKVKFIYQFALGYDYMVKNRLIHCDMKLDNLLVKDNHLMIADFGHTQMIEFVKSDICTTDLYQSPEYVREKLKGEAKFYNIPEYNWTKQENARVSDLWTFGAICLDIVYNTDYLFERIVDKHYSRSEFYYMDELAKYRNEKTIPEILMLLFGDVEGEQKELLDAISPFLDIDPEQRKKYNIQRLITENPIFKRYNFEYTEASPLAYQKRISKVRATKSAIKLAIDVSNKHKINRSITIMSIDFIFQFYDKFVKGKDADSEKFFVYAVLWLYSTTIDDFRFNLMENMISGSNDNLRSDSDSGRSDSDRSGSGRSDSDSGRMNQMHKMIFKIVIKTKGNILCDSIYHHLSTPLYISNKHNKILSLMMNVDKYLSFQNYDEAAKYIETKL